MSKTPEERLSELVQHARVGWNLCQENSAFRGHAQRWLAGHPSGWREVDELWRECLVGEGPLAAWLSSGADPSTWRGFPSLHSVLAGHPFPDLPSWSSLTRSHAS